MMHLFGGHGGRQFSQEVGHGAIHFSNLAQPVVEVPGQRCAGRGGIDRGKTEVEAIHLIPAMRNTLRDYEGYCKDRLHLRPSTMDRRTTELTIFLDFLHSRKARSLDEIQALDLSEFVSWREHLKPKTISGIVSHVSSFLRFLTMRGILQ